MPDPIQDIAATIPAPASQGAGAVTAPVSVPDASATPATFSAPDNATPTTTPDVAQTPDIAAAETPKVADTGETLLSEARTKEPEAKEIEAKSDEAKAPESTDAVVLPSYETFAVPEGIKLDEKLVGDFNKLLGEFEVKANVPHDAAQALGQQLVDFFISEQKASAERVQNVQLETWNKVRDSWKDEFRKDPDIGGNRQETTIRKAGAVIERYGSIVGPEKEAALRNALRVTGAGDHPEVIRFVNWVAGKTVETARPVAANTPKAPVLKSRADRRYSASSGAN